MKNFDMEQCHRFFFILARILNWSLAQLFKDKIFAEHHMV